MFRTFAQLSHSHGPRHARRRARRRAEACRPGHAHRLRDGLERERLFVLHGVRRCVGARRGRRGHAHRQGHDAPQARRHRRSASPASTASRSVANKITVLPLSRFDDELRQQIARSIYGHANFFNYAAMTNPPIHIIVEHGAVTLTGVVASDVGPIARAHAGPAVPCADGEHAAQDRRRGARGGARRCAA